MSDNKSTSLINLGELSRPATVLIEKISGAIGVLYEPRHIRQIAKANSDASLIEAETQIQITDLNRRAMVRFVNEETKKQENIEEIIKQSLPHIKDSATPKDIDDDWLTNFFEKSRIVSDDQMQELWTKVLAGEANNPGGFSKRTVNLLSDLDKSDALLFQKLCQFSWRVGDYNIPLVFDVSDPIYEKQGLNFSLLSHLDTLGLITFGIGFRQMKLPKSLMTYYYDEGVPLEFPNDSGNELDIGGVAFTQAGGELAKISGAEKLNIFPHYVKEKWATFIPKK